MSIVSKPEILGEQILKKILTHDYSSGGKYLEISGSPGSGKTSVMLTLLQYNLMHYPTEKCFFSSVYNVPLQFLRLPKKYWNFMVQKDSNVIFQDRAQKLKQVYPDVTYFDDFEDLYEKAIPGKCNAVFFGDRMKWMDYIKWLLNVGEWNSVYMDEFSEICPSNVGGERYKKHQDFAFTMKEIRKCQLTVATNSQSSADIDWRVRSKLQYLVYLTGARPANNSLVKKEAIARLEVSKKNGNQSYIEEYGGRFGLVRWRYVFEPNPGFQLQARVVENEG